MTNQYKYRPTMFTDKDYVADMPLAVVVLWECYYPLLAFYFYGISIVIFKFNVFIGIKKICR